MTAPSFVPTVIRSRDPLAKRQRDGRAPGESDESVDRDLNTHVLGRHRREQDQRGGGKQKQTFQAAFLEYLHRSSSKSPLSP